MAKKISLTKGKFALVDDQLFDFINQWKWCFVQKYAIRFTGPRNKRKVIFMHRLIAKTPDELFTDHINGDQLDNRFENLRICTKSENGMNRGAMANNTSGFKGVSWINKYKKYRAHISVSKKNIHLGYFDDPVTAAHVYDQAAKKYHGKFANVNFENH